MNSSPILGSDRPSNTPASNARADFPLGTSLRTTSASRVSASRTLAAFAEFAPSA
jgi:hypothetical protein